MVFDSPGFRFRKAMFAVTCREARRRGVASWQWNSGEGKTQSLACSAQPGGEITRPAPEALLLEILVLNLSVSGEATRG